MQHIVRFSGGVSSFVTAHRVIEQYGTADTTLLFADTKMEDADLYRFLEDAERFFDLHITRIADGRTPWQVFRDVRFMGNVRVDPCSKILKRVLLDRWVAERFTPETCINYYGLSWDEMHRVTRLSERLKPWVCRFPLCEKPLMTKDQCLAVLKRCGIEAPRLYAMGFPHNNCGGFCVKAGQAQFALLYHTMPERYTYHERQEEAMRAQLGDVSILRDRRGGTTRSLTLRRFREDYLHGTLPVDDEEWGGCGCAVDVEN